MDTSKSHGAITPKLVVRGADAAIDFYRRVFGAELQQRFTAGESVVFAQLQILGSTVQLKDEDTHDPSPSSLGRPGVLLSVDTEDPDGVARAVVDAGGEVVFEVGDQPYGARGGRVRDPFGHEWLVQTPLTWSSEEIQSGLDGAG
ncbi:VOC family protein [Occultella gossypii]|uniref:VOC family protein n=1 Tax=Occultella gossypii TaxID=2800820 RepID=A0ABS7SHA7_9MICO|nr:VOC family protein [Occultella gossypii]MBZ2199303.1 VOC family protein [Occultella gossypii]